MVRGLCSLYKRHLFLIPNRSGLVTHFKLKCRSTHDLFVGDVTLIIGLSIQFNRLDINILSTDARSQDVNTFPSDRFIFTSGNKGVPISYWPLTGSTG